MDENPGREKANVYLASQKDGKIFDSFFKHIGRHISNINFSPCSTLLLGVVHAHVTSIQTKSQCLHVYIFKLQC